MKISKKILNKAKQVKLIVSDVDGVLTRGEIIVFNNGEEVKIWNVKDGAAYNALLKSSEKIKTAWITGRKSIQVKRRAKEMNIDYLVQNCVDKKSALEKILKLNNLKPSQVAFVGDDIIDIYAIKISGLSVCPNDASKDVKKGVDYISEFNGGEGVLRDVVELILKAKGVWKNVLEKYK
ncbi:MAG: HAD hydrolase family protein [Elusimicrobiota bacterium]|jgi:3-deoxy-D-manno-octulosonate 8-phosphate phosphatase (KDO 8-P phosphatase)|nr:HAD hydrolase family protein [Elusimicrobiota bacterium]